MVIPDSDFHLSKNKYVKISNNLTAMQFSNLLSFIKCGESDENVLHQRRGIAC